MYILDEPSIGLHQRDNTRLLKTLFHLRDLGNTVIVVEHDEDAIRNADHVIDIGPGPACMAAKSSHKARLRIFSSRKTRSRAGICRARKNRDPSHSRQTRPRQAAARARRDWQQFARRRPEYPYRAFDLRNWRLGLWQINAD